MKKQKTKSKIKCVPKRLTKKPGPKTVAVKRHKRTKPKPTNKKCKN